ncbi:MAG: hypothetical protein ABFD89_08330 [Bryobacteraceae bacterium]
MPQAFYILFGAVFTAVTAIALGKLLLRGLGLKFYRAEEHLFSFVTGSACLSFLVFLLSAAQLARKGVFLALGILVIAVAIRRGAHHPAGESQPPLPRSWRIIGAIIFTAFTVLYLSNAMAPEMSPDGSSYHLGIVARYLREHGFSRITTNMYANLSQGVEMLFLFAFAFGRHSAAAMVHFSFLVALPLLMLAYGKRFGFPKAGAAAAFFFFASPVVGIDGISAYVDVATACNLFTIFFLLQIWDKERKFALVPLIGLLAGFSYAIKYTAAVAIPYAAIFLLWKMIRAREPWLRAMLVFTGCALLLVVPWVAKNWIILGNPFSPFFNKYFPNPYVLISFEKEYTESMRHYPGLKSYGEIPLEVTIRGAILGGFLGPLFLLAPLGLAALRWREGRQLLLAAAVFGSTYFANIGTRFLISPLPFVALAMAIVLTQVKGIALALMLVHAFASWPPYIKIYSKSAAWRLEKMRPKQALRIESEDSFLNFRWAPYVAARFVEKNVPEGGKVLAMNQIADAYTSREILVCYQSALNCKLMDILWSGSNEGMRATWQLTFDFPEQKLRRLRVVQTAQGASDLWSIAEFRVFDGGKELPRLPDWRLRARPNPWDVQMAFDNSPVTRWRSWETLSPGMYMEVEFGKPVAVDCVRLDCSHDQYQARVRLDGQLESGEWKTLAAGPKATDVPEPFGLRRAAVAELKLRGIHHLMLWDSDYSADEFRTNTGAWGMTLVGERAGARLYRFN